MKALAYDHFKSLFKDCRDLIICVDDKLNIVYSTDRVIPTFCKSDISLLHLGTVFSQAVCNQVAFAISGTPHAVSFDFTSEVDKTARSCLVVPTIFKNAYYLVLHISEAKQVGEGTQQITDMVSLTAGALADYTSPILDIANTLPQSDKDTITQNVFKIRKAFASLEIAATSSTGKALPRVINFYEYMKLLLPKVEARLGKSRFSYTLVPCGDLYLSYISSSSLDIMVINLITEMIIRAGGRTHTYVTVCGDSTNCFIIISDCDHGLGYTPSELLEESGCECTQIMNGRIIAARTVVSKLARENGGKAFFTQTFGGGVTHGIMLKQSKARKTTLSEQAFENTRQNEILDVFLSDI